MSGNDLATDRTPVTFTISIRGGLYYFVAAVSLQGIL